MPRLITGLMVGSVVGAVSYVTNWGSILLTGLRLVITVLATLASAATRCGTGCKGPISRRNRLMTRFPCMCMVLTLATV